MRGRGILGSCAGLVMGFGDNGTIQLAQTSDPHVVREYFLSGFNAAMRPPARL